MQSIKYLALGLALAFSGTLAAAKEPDAGKTAELKMAVRDLWVGHVFWSRNVAVNLHAKKKPAAAVAEAKVVENARAIADAIGGFYGKEAGDQMFKLLAAHYGAMKKHMIATFKKNSSGKKDKKGQDKAIKEGLANVDAIATFLSAANPNLPKATLQSVLGTHGSHHFAQNEAIRKGDWKNEADIWDQMRQHMLDVADVLAGAIAKQFPEKFQEE